MLTPEQRAVVRDAFLEGRDREATEMLMDHFCASLTQWSEAIEDNVRRNGKDAHGAAYAGLLPFIRRDISKSGLLARLIYGGEKLRTVMCPVHRGEMDTAMWIGASPACKHGCQGTGWLPEK